MRKRIIFVLALAMLILPLRAISTQPDLSSRNIEFSVEIQNAPKKIGDLLRFSWSFTLREIKDTMLQRFYSEMDGTLIAKAYLSVYPQQEFISGDSIWWGELEYDKIYSFTATYKIISASRIIGTPTVDICKEMYKNKRENRRSQNDARGFIFDIEGWDKREEPISGFVAHGDDTVFYSTGEMSDFMYPVDLDYAKRHQDILESKRNAILRTKRMLLDFTNLNNGDTVEVPVMADSTLIIFFRDKTLTIHQINNRSDAEVIQKSPGQIEILLDKQLNKNIIELDLGDGKTIFLKIR